MFFTLNTKASVKFGLTIISIVFLGYAIFTNQKYGFYTSLKIFIFISSIYLAVLGYESKQNFWIIRFVIIALIYNPFFRFPFGKVIWKPINILTLSFFAISLLKFRIDDNEPINNTFISIKNSNETKEIEKLKKEIEVLKKERDIK